MALSKPFAVNGNKVDIPLNKTDDGNMNYEEGFGIRYEQPIKAVIDEKGNITSTGGLQITRPQFNGLMNDLSRAIIENQEKILANHQHITKVENTMSGCAFLVRDNQFGGANSFSGATSFKAVVTFNQNATFNTANFNTISATAIHSNTIKTNTISASALQTDNATIDTLESETANVKGLFSDTALIDTLENKVNPKVLEPLAYSAMASDSLITKGDLEAQISYLKSAISAMAQNINGGNASFDTLRVKTLIVSSGANVVSGSANTATATTFADSGLHLVKFNNKN